MNKEVTKMTDKKMTVIRIIIFTAVSYGISSARTGRTLQAGRYSDF